MVMMAATVASGICATQVPPPAAMATTMSAASSADSRVLPPARTFATEVAAPLGNVEVFAFDGLLRDFVRTHSGRVVVRGLRTGGDFEYEFQMAGMNRKLMPEVETIFLTPGERHQYTSSTFVRELATLGGEVAEFVSPGVLARLNERCRTGG